MGVRIDVDYNAMLSTAESMMGYYREILDLECDVLKSIGAMGNYWQGKRYADLCAEFVSIGEGMGYSSLDLSGYIYHLRKVANEYGWADDGLEYHVPYEIGHSKIGRLRIPTSNEIRFIQEAIEPYERKVKMDLQDASAKAGRIQSLLQSLSWTSTNSESYKSKFYSDINKYKKSLDSLLTSFTTIMAQEKTDYATTEKNQTPG